MLRAASYAHYFSTVGVDKEYRENTLFVLGRELGTRAKQRHTKRVDYVSRRATRCAGRTFVFAGVTARGHSLLTTRIHAPWKKADDAHSKRVVGWISLIFGVVPCRRAPILMECLSFFGIETGHTNDFQHA